MQECWGEPVYHRRREHSSAGGGMLAGGLIDGVIGRQVVHQAVNDDGRAENSIEGYEEHGKSRYRVSYRDVVDDYDVACEYPGREYQLVMPYDPGKYIKMRIEFAPVI